MIRSLKLEFSGAIYHVASPGWRWEDIFLSDDGRTIFLNRYIVTVTSGAWAMLQSVSSAGSKVCKNREVTQ